MFTATNATDHFGKTNTAARYRPAAETFQLHITANSVAAMPEDLIVLQVYQAV
jgi:hypothetical protein